VHQGAEPDAKGWTPGTWAAGLLCLAGGASVLWPLWEQDVFWQVRSGDEILRGLGIQRVDTWSLTARGQPWVNFQWLATVVMRLLWGLGQVPALVVARAVGATLVLALAWAVARRAAPTSGSWPGILLVAATYLCVAFRFQVRPDLLVLLLFGAQVWWLDRRDTLGWRGRVGLLLLLVVVVNLHAGVLAFLVAVAVVHAVGDQGLSRAARAAWCAAYLLVVLATPYGISLPALLWEQVLYGHYYALPNSDQAGISLAWDSVGVTGLGPWAWLAWCVVAWVAAARALRARGAGAGTVAWVVVGVGLTALCLVRARAIPYHVFYFLPEVARWMGPLVTRAPPWRRGLACVLLVAAGAAHRLLYPFPLGLGLWEGWPVGAADFVRQERPQGNILHSHGAGGYLVWALPDYPTFADTRDPLFRHLHDDFLASADDPGAMHRLCERWDINTAIMPIPQAHVVEGQGWADPVAAFFPYGQWAVVHFDDRHVVHLRRVPAHARTIHDDEYFLLLPQFPPDAYLRSGRRSPAGDQRHAHEVARCLRQVPTVVHCAVAQSALWRDQGTPEGRARAVQLLDSLGRRGHGHPWLLQERAALAP
jgi:hypothetical protein